MSTCARTLGSQPSWIQVCVAVIMTKRGIWVCLFIPAVRLVSRMMQLWRISKHVWKITIYYESRGMTENDYWAVCHHSFGFESNENKLACVATDAFSFTHIFQFTLICWHGTSSPLTNVWKSRCVLVISSLTLRFRRDVCMYVTDGSTTTIAMTDHWHHHLCHHHNHHCHHCQDDFSTAGKKAERKAVNRLCMPFNISWAGTLKLSCIFKSSTKSITRAFSVQALCVLELWRDLQSGKKSVPLWCSVDVFVSSERRKRIQQERTEIYFSSHFDMIITLTKKWNNNVVLNQLRVLKGIILKLVYPDINTPNSHSLCPTFGRMKTAPLGSLCVAMQRFRFSVLYCIGTQL